MIIRILAAALLLSVFSPDSAAQPLIPLLRSGSLTFGSWSFDWTVGKNAEGLELKRVFFKGRKVIHKASLPVVRVKYRGDGDDVRAGCGPYLDRLDWGHMNTPASAPTNVVARVHDDTILEMAVFAEIGGYDLYQAWFFHKSGRLEAVLYSKGWSCGETGHRKDHKHHPYWRIDFDVEGTNNEIWEIRTKKSGHVSTIKRTTEGNTTRLSTDADLAWTINKPGSNRHVLIRQPGNQFRDSDGSPWFAFSNKDAAWRRHHSSEDVGWDFDSEEHLGYRFPAAESTNSGNIVFWSVGHLFHEWSPADENEPHWHWTKAVIDVVNF